MPVKTSQDGRRTLELTLEVPGTPEQVWQAVATGQGITAWFVPSEVEERVGGAVAFHLAPEMTSTGRVTAWEPPRRFAYEEPNWSGEAPPLGTEFTVQAAGSGACTVRIVHSLATERGDWDQEMNGMESGWTAFFAVLRLYLRHFAGQPAAVAGPSISFAGSHAEARAALEEALGLAQAAVGAVHDTSVRGGPRVVGTVEHVTAKEGQNAVTLKIDQPAPGAAVIGSYEWGGAVQIAVSLYFYGANAAAHAEQEGKTWRAWLAQRFGGEAKKEA